MSLHKLTAGDGYTYLTRQVAANDGQSRGRDGLAAYYAEKGESPGVWLGAAATGRHGFPAVGDAVSELQMVALFGEGRHPHAEQIEVRLAGAGHRVSAILTATQLGRPYCTRSPQRAFRPRLAAALAAAEVAAGRQPGGLPDGGRAQVRTALVREMFVEEHGRDAADVRELGSFAARVSRPPAGPVAGYDLTFTPVKSVSALWAVAPREVADAIEQAHADAVRDSLGWLERHAVFTRLGAGGTRQVEVTGLLAVAFTHRDSRAGDPNLHTHVAISNKVQVADTPAAAGQAGQWRALDGRPLHALAVAASERYNTRLEALLTDRLQVRFADRPGTAAGKRAVREIVGVDDRLTRVWAARRASIDVRRAELSTTFQAEHGRPPSPVEAIKLAQQATLETRQGKHAPRSHAEQRATWREQAAAALGGPPALEAMLSDLNRAAAHSPRPPAEVTAGWVADTAQVVLETVQGSRATWQQAHIRAEAERQVRAAALPLVLVDDAVERVVGAVLSPALSLPLGPPDTVVEPRALRRTDGTSVFTRAGSQLFTSAQVLAAERTLVDLAGRRDGRITGSDSVDRALQDASAAGQALNAGQAALVRELATSGARVQLALAPAGTGKTTALTALSHAWTAGGGQVLGLAPSAAAASVLGDALNARGASGSGGRLSRRTRAPTDTLAKLLWSLDQLAPAPGALPDRMRSPAGSGGRVPPWVHAVGPRTLVLIDEAGMAGTAELARAVGWVISRGGSVRLVGDDAQLAAVGAGGVLRDLAHTHAAVRLQQVVRFTDPAEAAASLALREGDPSSLGFYLDHQRVHVGDPTTAANQAFAAWQADRASGRDSLLLAATRDTVTALNVRARADRLAAAVPAGGAGPEVALTDGTWASAGDEILTRRNDRRLTIAATDWVKNGDRFTVQHVLPGGALRAIHPATGRRVVLPAAYVAEHVQLGYASTVHTAQGRTADTSHTVLTGAEDRQLLYVAASRGRTSNSLYLQTADDGDEHAPAQPDSVRPPTAAELLTRILGRDGAQTSATSTWRQLADPAGRLADEADRYLDSLTVAAAKAFRNGSRFDHGRAAGRPAPLPWLPPVSAALAEHPVWGGYLIERARRVEDLARQIAYVAEGWTTGTAPAWATRLGVDGQDGQRLIGRLAVWRAVHRVPDSDLRPTGPPNLRDGPATNQQALDAAIPRRLDVQTSTSRWADLAEYEPRLAADPGWTQLIARLDAVPDTLDVRSRALQALADGPLPDELPAAALWWRLTRTLPAGSDQAQAPARAFAPTAATTTDPATTTAPATAADRWKPVVDTVDSRLSSCPAWPALASALDRAQHSGYDVAGHLPRLIADGPLPGRYPTRSLHYRLIGECDAAITPAPSMARSAAPDDHLSGDPARLAPAAGPVHLSGSTHQRPVYRAAPPARGRAR